MGPRLGKGFEAENQAVLLLQHPDVARDTASWFESVGGVLFFDKILLVSSTMRMKSDSAHSKDSKV